MIYFYCYKQESFFSSSLALQKPETARVKVHQAKNGFKAIIMGIVLRADRVQRFKLISIENVLSVDAEQWLCKYLGIVGIENSF